MKFTKKISNFFLSFLVMVMVITSLGLGNGGIVKASANVISQDGLGFSGTISGAPLQGNITMSGYNNWPDGVSGGSLAFSGGVYDGQYIWLIPYNASKVVRIDASTGEMTGYANWPSDFTKTSNAFVGGVFDGRNVWMVPYQADKIVKLDTVTGSMTSFVRAGDVSLGYHFYGGVFDGQNIWLIPYNSDVLVKIDKDTGEMTSYDNWPSGFNKNTLSYAFAGGVFDGKNIWMIPDRADRVMKFDTETSIMTGYTNWPAGFTKGNSAFIGGTYDGTYVWLIPANADRLIRLDPSTGEMIGYNNWPAGFSKPASVAFAGGTYDGRDLWLHASSADRMIKLDLATYEMTGYSNWPSGYTKGAAAFRGGVYDGQSIWLVPMNADRVVRVMGELSSTISPTTDDFDIYNGSVNYKDITVTMSWNGNSLTDILFGGTSIGAANYSVTGNNVTLKKEYLATLGTGTHTITFDMSAGVDPQLTVVVNNSTPQNSTLNPTTASFDKNTATPGYADVTTTLTPNGNTLTDILREGISIGAGNYTVVGNDVTIKKEYLATLGTGVQTFTFDVSAGVDPTLTVTVNHTPITANAANNSVTANPTSVTLGASITLTATGDRQAANGTAIGDEKYVPVDWTSDDGATGTFSINGSDYTSTYIPTGAGTRTVTATFKKNTWNGTVWNDSGSSDSKTVTVTVNALVNAETPSITTQPADQTVNVGGNATLNVAASVSDGGTLSYQWYSNTTNSNSGGTAISGADSDTYAAPTTSAGTTYYYVEVTNTNNGVTGSKTATATSNLAAVTVNALTNAETPTITTQPADKTVNIGGNATLNVAASVSDGGTLSYQWYSNATNSNSGGTAISGADSETYAAPTTSAGTTYYYVEVTNTNTSATGSKTATATSNLAAVTVNALTNAETPIITAQPADKTVNIGGNATLNVAASVSDGGTLSYQWYSNTSNSSSGGTAISGADSDTYAAPTTSTGTTYYYVEVTNTNNGVTGSKTATATSNPAAVTVNALTNAETPIITAQPADKTVNVGGNATLNVAASVSDGGTLSYQWYSNTTNSNSGGTAISGAESDTYATPTTSAGTTYYYVEVTNTNTSATGSQTATATSNPAAVKVHRPAEPIFREIISITNPESITGVANGTPKEADALGLPKTVEVTLDNGSKLDIGVRWDVANADYNPREKEEQSFTVSGELVKLPNGVINSRSLKASVRVSVDAAAQGDIVGIENPGDITGLPNGTPKKAEALGLPEQVRVTLEDGTQRKVSVKWDVAGSDYDPAREEEQSFTVTGELVKLPEGITNSQKLKASVHVQVKAADDGGGDSRKIIKVAQPAPITGVENGTRKTAKALGLPKEVKVTLDDGSTLRVEVKWDVEDADYDPDSRKKQRFTVNGKLVDLPDDVENPENLGVSIRVTVDAVERDDDRDDRDNRRDRGKDDQSNDTKTRHGKIEAGKHNDYSGSLLLEIIRKTTAGGKQVDEVVFDKKKAKEILEHAEERNKDVIRITIDDLPNALADEVLVKVPESTVELLQDRQVALEIKTAGVIITISREAVANLPHEELEFRIIPIRQHGEQQAVAQRTLNAEEVKQAAGGQRVLVVGKPIVIEANYSNRKTKVTFPLTDVQLPNDPNALRSYLSSLAVYVEHSDGDKELKSGEIRYDQQGKPEGIEIEVTKFSTFTVLSLQEKQEQVVHEAYMTGYPDGTFQPNRIMTRAEAAAVLATLMQEAGQEQTTETTAAFADVPASHWAAKEIQKVHGAGLMMGDGSGLFHPFEKVTRAEMAAILVKMKKLSPQGKSATFGDTQGHWAQASIAIAVEQGIMKGYADGSFRPNQGLTRAEAATLINRLTGRGPLTGITKAIWSDVPLTHWAFAEIAEATLSHTAVKLADGTERNINQQ